MDINRLGGIIEEKDENGLITNIYKEKNPSEEIDMIGVLGNSYTYIIDEYGTAYAPENYIQDNYTEGKYKEKYERLDRKTEGDVVKFDSYGYMYETLGLNTRVYNMFFAETTENDQYAKSYWLASPGVFGGGSNADFGLGAVRGGVVFSGFGDAFGSNGHWFADGMAVRPVAVLQSGITINQVEKSENQEEHEIDWTENNTNTLRGSGNVEEGIGYVDSKS